MITISPFLTLLSVAVLPLFLLPTRRVARILRDIRRKAMNYNADLSSLINETLGINGVLLIKTFGRQRQETERFKEINQNVRDIGIRRALVGRLPIEIQDRPGAIQLASVRGQVQFDNVSFSYMKGDDDPIRERDEWRNLSEDVQSMGYQGPDNAHRWALRELSFEINPGELVALVGHSGAGKTTVTYLLPRLYDPTGGKISLDGYDIRDVTQESLVNQIGMVTQETYLFHDTVLSNLLYARPLANKEDIIAACQAAHIHEFIQELPEGYDTVVGERGYRLSGGEKQRLAIARVILKDPRILILDEATSHLDSHNEALIQAALAPLLSGRTSLVIAHRLSTILAADKILVLDRGQLIEQGTHKELLEHEGLYSELYETQFKAEDRNQVETSV
jgi:ATP-binding cassette subfamily B protein